MFYSKSGLIVLILLGASLAENSARVACGHCEDNCDTCVEEEVELGTTLKSSDDKVKGGNNDSSLNGEGSETIVDKELQKYGVTTKEAKEKEDYEVEKEEDVEKELEDHIFLISGNVTEPDTEEDVTIQPTNESVNETELRKSDENYTDHSLTNTNEESDLALVSDNTSGNPVIMTSEVQVEDFMKSRVAYHDAVLHDINDIKIHSSNLFDKESKVSMKGNVGTPERLTMEETVGEAWREIHSNELQNPDVGDRHADLEMNTQQFLDQSKANAKIMDINETLTDRSLEVVDNFTFDSPVASSTQHTTAEKFIEENTDESKVAISQTRHPNYNEEHLDEIQETEPEEIPRTEIETVLPNIADEDVDRNYGNDPVAERLYSFGMNEVNRENSLNNKLEDHSDTYSKQTYPQSFRDYKDISEEDLMEVQNLLPDHPSFKKEKIEPGVLFEECIDCDFRVLPIRPSEQRDAPKMEEESLPSPTVRFPDLPDGRELQIYSLGLSEGFFLFGYLSEFLSWIQPNEFPVELLRDALRSQITWLSLITQSLKVEAGFVACLVAGVLFALAVPVVVLSHACYRMTSRDDDGADDKVGWAGNCRRRTLVFILQILLVLLLGGMVAMFVTNEQLSEAVVRSSDVIQTCLSDVSAFVHNSHLQLHFLVTQSMDHALNAVYADLDNVDTLLGRPIQRELVRETGIDVALESLADLTREAKETTQQVERLMDEVRVVQEMVVSTSDKLADLRQQVELFRRACGPRDRALCDTIDASGLQVTLRLDKLKNDGRLNRMRRMGGVGLETAAAEAKARFMSVPSRVETDTRDAREAARRQLIRQRADVDDRSVALERLVRDMTGKVSDAKYAAGFWMQDIDQYEYWRWIVCMGGGAAVLMVWLMLLCSLCCGCCGSEKAAGPTILLTIVLVCLLSTALWTVALVGMLFGGHGEVFVCRPLYDEPEYHVISRLVDQPGVFYSEPRGGFIANVIYGNDTLDVPIRHVLEECRENRGLYPTLGLGRVFDVEAAVDQHRWTTSTTQLRSVRANLSSLEVLSPVLQDQLGDLLATLSVNFTEHRIQMSRPVVGKDLDSFARQLDNIGNQMRDLAVASRMETLSSRTRRLLESHIRPLEGRKDALVYQLTALEVQTGPLQRQVNQSLSHLKTIQFFINSQGEAIAQRKSRQYVERLLSYVEQLRRHVLDSISSSVAPCRPLWDIFNTTRLFLCRHTMDPLNGFWFASMWCLIVLLVATPVCLKLVDYYRARGSRSSGSPSANLMISEQGAAWSSPGYDIKYSKEQCIGNGDFKQ